MFCSLEFVAQTSQPRKEIYAISLFTKTDFKSPLYSFDIGFKPIHSFSSGLVIKVGVQNRFSFRSDLLREKKGAYMLFDKWTPTNNQKGKFISIYLQYNLYYITSRNFLCFGIGKKQRLLLVAGGYLSLLTHGQSYVREEGDPEIQKNNCLRCKDARVERDLSKSTLINKNAVQARDFHPITPVEQIVPG
jgi:hypothetical protein